MYRRSTIVCLKQKLISNCLVIHVFLLNMCMQRNYLFVSLTSIYIYIYIYMLGSQTNNYAACKTVKPLDTASSPCLDAETSICLGDLKKASIFSNG